MNSLVIQTIADFNERQLRTSKDEAQIEIMRIIHAISNNNAVIEEATKANNELKKKLAEFDYQEPKPFTL